MRAARTISCSVWNLSSSSEVMGSLSVGIDSRVAVAVGQPEAGRGAALGVELDEHGRLLADHPRVVAGLDHHRARRGEIEGAAVGVGAAHAAAGQEPDVCVPAERRVHQRLHVGGPAEAGRVAHPLHAAVGGAGSVDGHAAHLAMVGARHAGQQRIARGARRRVAGALRSGALGAGGLPRALELHGPTPPGAFLDLRDTDSPREACQARVQSGVMSVLLDARDLVKHLGGRRVFDGVDLACESSQIVGLLGPNGAGKTTTLRMLYGFLHPDEGRIHVDGVELGRDLVRAKRSIGVCTQDDTFDGDFTVEQNLTIAATYFRPRPTDLDRRVAELLERFELGPYAGQKPETLSGGYRRRLMIARALVHRPRLLFLDEPTTGLDPQARMGVWDLVDGLRAEGLGIILTTHYMDEAERLSDALTVLARGRVVARGTAKTVLGDLVGEHVVVVDAGQGPAVAAWLAARGRGEPASVLGALHLPLSGEELAEFARAFPALRYEVRGPTLDDLFLKLSLAP